MLELGFVISADSLSYVSLARTSSSSVFASCRQPHLVNSMSWVLCKLAYIFVERWWRTCSAAPDPGAFGIPAL